MRTQIPLRIARAALSFGISAVLLGTVRARIPDRPSALNECTESSTLGKWYPVELASDKIFVSGRMNRSRPLQFIIDTGAPSGFIDDRLVAELGFTPATSTHGSGSAGSSEVVVTRLEPPACQVAAGAVLPGASVSALRISEISAAEGLLVDGLIGGDFFARHVVEIDYLKQSIPMLPPSFDGHRRRRESSNYIPTACAATANQQHVSNSAFLSGARYF